MTMRVAGLLLAGGRSRRFGQDKRFLEFEGRPLIVRAYEALSAAADEIWVLLAHADDEPKVREALGPRPLRVAVDPEPGAGPLGALAGALALLEVDCEYGLLLAVDYPLLAGSFLRRMRSHLETLAKQPDVLVPVYEGIPQVTCAFYRRALAGELQEALNRGERSLRRFVEGLPPERVALLEEEVWRAWGSDALRGVNTPEDYERLLRLRAR